MSSSFVKDCSDLSGCGTSNSNKTVIIIVNNDMGNVSLDGNELQNLLASHGADASQVSVVQMGGGTNYGNVGNSLIPVGNYDPCALNAALPLNFTVDGFPTIPLEGVTVGGYAELPLDADALQRLESVLETEEAKEILGEPLLDIVNNPGQLVQQLENLMPSADAVGKESVGTLSKSKRPPPKRRSQRQMDKAEREEVEKILAENQKMLKEEREQLRRAQEEEEQVKEEEEEEKEVMEMADDDLAEGNEAEEAIEVETKKVSASGKSKGKGKGKKSPPSMQQQPGKEVEVGKTIKGKGVKKIPLLKENVEKVEILEKKKVNKPKGKVNKRIGMEKQEELTDVNCKVPKDVLMKKLSVKVKKLNRKDIELTPLVTGGEDNKEELNGHRSTSANNIEESGKLPSTNSGENENDTAKNKDLQNAGIRYSTPPPPSPAVEGESGPLASKDECKNPDPPVATPPPSSLTTKVNNMKKGEEDPLNNRKEIANSENPRESSVNKGIKNINNNSTNVNSTNLSGSVFNLNKRKVLKVLTPVEKREVVVLNSVSVRMQRENLVKIIPPLHSNLEQHKILQNKTKNPQKKSPNENKKGSKISFENQLNMGNGPDKNKQNLTLKIDEKTPPSTTALMHRSPAISKSLMNYKIPLKNSAARQLHNQSSVNNPSLNDNSFYSNTLTPSTPSLTPTTPTAPKTPTTPKNHFNATKPTPSLSTSQTNVTSNSSSPSLEFNSHNKTPFSKKIHKTTTKTDSILNKAPNAPKNNSSYFNPQKNSPKKNPQILKIKSNVDNVILKVKTPTRTNNVETKSAFKNATDKSSLGKVNPKIIVNSGNSSSKNLNDITPKMSSKLNAKKQEEKYIPTHRNSVDDNVFSIRRSGRPIKKKTFGDDILILDDENASDGEDDDDGEEEESDQLAEHENDDHGDADKEKLVGSSDGEEGADDDSDDSDEDEEKGGHEDDDPERLWCICQKPHSNRFMICCDRCEDWFHGSCVGITKPKGKQMEEEEREWICPNCKKAERAIKGVMSPVKKEPVKNQMMESPSKREQDISITKVVPAKKEDKKYFAKKFPGRKMSTSIEKTEPRVLVYEKSSGIVLSGTSAPTLNVLGEWLKSHPTYTTLQPAMMNSITTDPKSGMKRIPLEQFGLAPEKGNKSNKGASFQDKIDSAYTSSKTSNKREKGRVTKMLEHSEVIQLERNMDNAKKPESKSAKKVSSSKSVDNDSYKKIPSSTFYKDKTQAARKHSFDRTDETASTTVTTAKKPPKDSKEFKKQLPKSPEVVERVPVKSESMLVRESVRKMLFDALDKRKSEAKNEFTTLTADSIQDLCKEIEEQLYLSFNKDVGFKYKSRYRSLVFNIRDTKNSGLFRKILNGAIPPPKLACMTSEELASKELAEWREREEKKELEAIQKHELERIALGNQYIMKSHKGEIVIDKEEFASKSKDTESVISLAPDPSKIVPTEVPEDEASSNHRNHIYDPNCKICAAIELKEFTPANKEVNNGKGNFEENDKEKEEKKRQSSTSRRESTSSHSKHKKRDKEKERRNSHKYKDKEREREKSKERHHESRKSKDKHHEKSRHRHSSTDDNDKQRSRHKSDKDNSLKEGKESGQQDGYSELERRSSKDDDSEGRRHKRQKETSSPKYDKKEKEHRKRKHSESRSEDKKRRDSDREHRRTHSESDEKTQSRSRRKESNKENEINMQVNKNGYESVKENFEKSSNESQVSTSADVYLPNFISNESTNVTERETTSAVVRSPINTNEVEEIGDLSPAHSIPFPDELDEEEVKSPLLTENLLSLPDSPSYSPDRSPSTPPLPIDIEESLLSPATPPLPDNDDRLTPPPPSSHAPKHNEASIQMPIWKGIISMPDVAKFSAASFEVSGKALFFTGDVPSLIEVVGRISPDNVWGYIAQMKKSGSKEILVVRFQPSSEEEKVSYIALYSYLSSKKRYGVIGNCEKSVKDFYIVPLASHQPIPQVLLPLDGPGFEESRPHMLIGVIVRTKHRRIYDPLTSSWISIGGEPQSLENQDGKELSAPSEVDTDIDGRSYTPPPSLPVVDRTRKDKKRRKVLSEDEPEFSPPSSASEESGVSAHSSKTIGSKQDRESMLAELNRQIEKDRKELSEMQRKVDEKIDKKDGSESSSKGSDSPPTSGSESLNLDTSKINIPSNLHEILNSIKKKEEAIKEKELEIKRRLSIHNDYLNNSQVIEDNSIVPGSKDVDLRLLLSQNRDPLDHSKDEDLRLLGKSSGGLSSAILIDQDFRTRDPRISTRDNHCGDDVKSALSKMSDADLLAKAMEMEGSESSTKKGFQHEDPRRIHASHGKSTQPPMAHPLPPPHAEMVGPPIGQTLLMRPPVPLEGPPPPNSMYGDPGPLNRLYRPPDPYNMPPGPSGLINPMPHGEPFGHNLYEPGRDQVPPMHMHGPPPEGYETFGPGVPMGGDRRPRMDEWEDIAFPRRGPWDDRDRRQPADWDNRVNEMGSDRWEGRRFDTTWQQEQRYPDEANTYRKRRWKDERRGHRGGGRWNKSEGREWREPSSQWVGGGSSESRKWPKDSKRPRKDRDWHNKDKKEKVSEIDY